MLISEKWGLRINTKKTGILSEQKITKHYKRSSKIEYTNEVICLYSTKLHKIFN